MAKPDVKGNTGSRDLSQTQGNIVNTPRQYAMTKKSKGLTPGKRKGEGSPIQKPPPIFEFSAGGVVLRGEAVLLIRTCDLKGSTVWTFPKGQLNQKETSPQAAIREVEEETGWHCAIKTELPKSLYWFQRKGDRIKKTVRWFLMEPEEEVGPHDEEVEEVAWVPIEEAGQRLSYKSDRHLLQQAIAGKGT